VSDERDVASTAGPEHREAVSRPLMISVIALFFVSGSAGLVYQVLWMRMLGLFFGSDMYGVSIILGTFMGGLALGSLLGGKLSERLERPLMAYGVAELGIGVFALLFPWLLTLLEPVLRPAYLTVEAGNGWVYQLIRVLLASGLLLVPTSLMGATLPLILKHFVRSRSHLGEMAGTFYAVNTLGALAGTLGGGFVLLPYLGTRDATLCAAATNVVIGIACVILGSKSRVPVWTQAQSGASDGALDPLPGLDDASRLRMARAAVVALGVSGFGSFALEVVWTRVLVASVSGTVYSFTSMLSCFLFGIFAGSLLIARRVDQHRDPLWLFASLELWIGACCGALCLAVNAIPDLFGGVFAFTTSMSSGDRSGSLVASTLVVSMLLLVVPTTLLGATFAVALRAYTTNMARVGDRTGALYSSNTFGAILGSLGGGLLLVPLLGTKGSLAALALLFCGVGLYLVANSAGGLASRRGALAAPVALTLLLVAGGLATPYHVTLNFNQRAGAVTELLYHAEGVQNTIDVVRSQSGVTSLVIGGNVEADDGPTQLRHFVLKGHLPLMFLERPRRVLVIGLGMGMTLRSTARHPGLERIDVVELSPEILRAHSAVLGAVNDDVVKNPLVHVTIDDGRNYLKMTDRRYDMITADPIHPKISRVGYLYTEDYYRSIAEHLAPGGIVCQWMPIYQISPTRLRSAMKAFANVFPQATFWYVKNHGLFVARRDAPLDFSVAASRFADPRVREDLASIDIHSPEDLLALLLLGPRDVRAYLDAEPGVPDNRDDRPYLEYFVPSDLFYKPIDNVRQLVLHASDPAEVVAGVPGTARERIRQLVEGRNQRLIAELEPPPATR
jgi:spermidine synthase